MQTKQVIYETMQGQCVFGQEERYIECYRFIEGTYLPREFCNSLV